MLIHSNFDGIYLGENPEQEMRKYLKSLEDYTDGEFYKRSTYTPTRVVIPNGYNIPLYDEDGANYSHAILSMNRKKAGEIITFWNKEFDKINNGDGECCGLQYKYYNYTLLRGHKGNRVDYRRHDEQLNSLMEDCLWGDKRGSGIYLLGRRRGGKTSIAMNAMGEVAARERNISMLTTSKSEHDAVNVVIGQKLKFILKGYPLPMRLKEVKSPAGGVHFGVKKKDEIGNVDILGRDNTIYAFSPTPTRLEGQTVRFWFHDEAPKTPHFKQLKEMTYPALADAEGFNRDGFALMAGVAGDFGKFGDDFKTLWKGAEGEGDLRWFMPGWAGLKSNEQGNENLQEAVMMILTRRHAILNNKELTKDEIDDKMMKEQQQYPLTLQEAFQSAGSSKFDTQSINAQSNYILNNPPKIYHYNVNWQVPKLKVVASPERTGKLQVLETPIKGQKYVSGGDVYGLKQKDTGSIGVQWIMKLKNQDLSPGEREDIIRKISECKAYDQHELVVDYYLKLGHIPVALYEENDPSPRVFAEHSARHLCWYWQGSHSSWPVKFLPETEPSNVLDYYMQNYINFLMHAPIRQDRRMTQKELSSLGINKKEYWVNRALEELEHYFRNYSDRIFFKECLDKALNYDESVKKKKHDIIDGLGNTLIAAHDPRIVKWNSQLIQKKEENSTKSWVNYRR